MTGHDETAQLEERLSRYAAELDERMARVDVHDAMSDRLPTATSMSTRSSTPTTTRDNRGRRVWLAAAAALVVLVAGSVVWWRTTPTTDELDVSTQPSGTTPPSTVAEIPSAAPGPITWEQTGLSTNLSGYDDVAEFHGELVAVGTDDVLMPITATSADGMTWGEESRMGGVGGGRPVSVAADDELVVAVGTGTGSAVSWERDDDPDWTARPINGAEEIRSVARTADDFIAVGSSRMLPNGEDAGTIVPAAWQYDLGAWTRVELPDVGSGEATDIAASDDTVLVVGWADGRPLTLAMFDGEWMAYGPALDDASAADDPGQLTAVAWSGDRFVVVGGRNNRAAMWESIDARTYTEVPVDTLLAADPIPVFQDVAAIGDTFVVVFPSVGSQILMEVPTWTRQDGTWEPGLTGALSVAAWNDRFVALGLEVWLSSPAGA